MKMYVKEETKGYGITSAKDVVKDCQDIAQADQEMMVCLTLNSQNHVIQKDIVAVGGVASACPDMKIIFRRVLQHGGAALILVHNHPSGSTEPSNADRELTKKVGEVCGIVDLRLLDHIVVGDGYCSFAERGWMNN